RPSQRSLSRQLFRPVAATVNRRRGTNRTPPRAAVVIREPAVRRGRAVRRPGADLLPARGRAAQAALPQAVLLVRPAARTKAAARPRAGPRLPEVGRQLA